ncbi:MAG: hypothetical protein C0602_07460 [Denitrovibrio sp.]|nr:MAG: hypothetical protein C0602_07460 [Denitrovibrio sp.]
MFRKSIFTMILSVLVLPSVAFAGVFDIYLETAGSSYSQSFSDFESVIDDLDLDQMEKNLSGYTETSAVRGYIDFRGIDINLSAAAGDTAIVLSIPAIGISETFSGLDRDASIDQIEDWLKDNGDGVMSKLMEELAASTATDPVAGNPTSAQSRMVSMDYDYAVNSDGAIEMNSVGAGSGLNANMVSIFARYSNYDLDGVSSKTYALPLAYTIKFNNSKNSLSIRVPISVINVDGSEAYNAGLGLGFTYFVNDSWSLVPAIGYTAVGSIDLASAAQLVSGSLTSSYAFSLDKYTLTMGNMVGYYKTIPFSYQDYTVDTDIKNTVFRNGLNLNIPSDGLAKGTSFEIFVTDTRYLGSELYVDQYNEVGLSYGFAKIKQKDTKGGKVKNIMRKVRLGFTYLFAKDVSGYSVNFGFSF